MSALAEAYPAVGDVRGRGAMMAMEIVRPGTKSPIPMPPGASPRPAIRPGVVVLTCGSYSNVIRLLPPLTIDDTLLTDGLDVLAEATAEVLSVAGSGPEQAKSRSAGPGGGARRGRSAGNTARAEASPASTHRISCSASRTSVFTRCPLASLAEATAALWTSEAACMTSMAWAATSAGTNPPPSTRSTRSSLAATWRSRRHSVGKRGRRRTDLVRRPTAAPARSTERQSSSRTWRAVHRSRSSGDHVVRADRPGGGGLPQGQTPTTSPCEWKARHFRRP